MNGAGEFLLADIHGNGSVVPFTFQRLVIMAHETIAVFLRTRVRERYRCRKDDQGYSSKRHCLLLSIDQLLLIYCYDSGVPAPAKAHRPEHLGGHISSFMPEQP
jgi:hypothetical protein